MMEESLYRQRVDQVLRLLDAAFEDVDPDLAESDYAQGTLVITFDNSRKLIVSPQTPLRQVWVAFRDRAWHLGLDESGRWVDDRDPGVELCTLVASITREEAGVSVTIGG